MLEITSITATITPRPTKREQAIGYLMVVLTPLCEHPEDLRIESTLDERGLVLNVLADPGDLRLLIGRKGAIASSLRNIMHVYGMRNYASIKLFVNRKEYADAQPNTNT